MSIKFDSALHFNQDAFSDITIRFSGKEIKAHKIILCSASEYFMRAIGPGSRFREATESTYELHDDDPFAVEEMLCFIYTSKYPSSNFLADGETPIWAKHLSVMIVADKYGISMLEGAAFKCCRTKLSYMHHYENLDLMELIHRSWDYSDADGKLNELIAHYADEEFLELYKDAVFRLWLENHGTITERLMEKHFTALLSSPEFREKLVQDGAMALYHLDRVTEELDSLKRQRAREANRRLT